MYIAGRAFQNEIDRTSGFQVINIDVNTKQGKVISYKWQKDKYTNLDELLLEYDRKKQVRSLILKELIWKFLII